MPTVKLPPSRAKAAKPIAKNGDAAAKRDYCVKDISLADFGRREIEVAEQEMPGLMAVRAKHGGLKPLRGVRVTGSLHMTIETAVLIRSEEHTSELQSRLHLVCRLLLEKKKTQ